MRPRYLLNLINHCKSIALNLNHARVEESDIDKGVSLYSKDCVFEINLEIQDVIKDVDDLLYIFTECTNIITRDDVNLLLTESLKEPSKNEEIIDALMWFGVFGVMRDNGEIAYVYTVDYDMKRLKALQIRRSMNGKNIIYHINPAFWSALEIQMENTA